MRATTGIEHSNGIAGFVQCDRTGDPGGASRFEHDQRLSRRTRGRLELLLEGSKVAGALREGDRFGLHPPVSGPDDGDTGGGDINADVPTVL